VKVAPRDRHRYRKCADCDDLVLPPRRKCNKCRKAKVTVTELRPSRAGMRRRGVSLTRPDKIRTRRAKRQHADKRTGNSPELRMMNYEFK
jgi:hypothetical protein